jgi:arsenite oxidase small subunit
MKKPHDPTRRRLVTWLWRLPVLGALAGGIYAFQRAWRVHFGKEEPPKEPDFVPTPPQRLASLAVFAEPYDAVEFTLEGTPALALRLTEPVAGGLSVGDVHLVAYSRVCTHLGCLVSFNRDTEAVAMAFNHRSDRPSLTCACHLSVFSPYRAGQAVSGPAVIPLPRIALELRGETLYAVGLERPPESAGD